MPIAFIFIGSIFVVAAVQGNARELGSLLKDDFTGNNNFIFWLAAITMVGAIGYVDELEPLSDGFLVLIVLALLLSPKGRGGGGFFEQLQSQLAESKTA